MKIIRKSNEGYINSNTRGKENRFKESIAANAQCAEHRKTDHLQWNGGCLVSLFAILLLSFSISSFSKKHETLCENWPNDLRIKYFIGIRQCMDRLFFVQDETSLVNVNKDKLWSLCRVSLPVETMAKEILAIVSLISYMIQSEEWI